jgi:hypothetical protein
MQRLITVVVVLVLAATTFAAAGCGSSTKTVSQAGANGEVTTKTVPNIHFAKTKFVLHMGLAFGAFHRYIYKPLKAGAFSSATPGRTKALIKAGVAAAFIVHELKIAREDALADEHLRPLAEKIDGLFAKVGSLASALKSGSLNPADIAGSAGAVAALSSAASGAGVTIKDLAPAL